MLSTSNMTDTEIRRLNWRCRRGLLELDIVLQRFAEQHLATLDADELAAFDSLLDYPDNTFLDVVTARIEAASTGLRETKAMQRLLLKLRNNLN